jgi:hypothetical protein
MDEFMEESVDVSAFEHLIVADTEHLSMRLK